MNGQAKCGKLSVAGLVSRVLAWWAPGGRRWAPGWLLVGSWWALVGRLVGAWWVPGGSLVGAC
eukprot:13024211-Alexandrium_andersonii.AAC.1